MSPEPSETPDPKAASASASQVVRRMMPSDANAAGSVHGGVVLRLCDEAAATSAMRHCRGRVVTANVDEVTFTAPVEVGDLLTLKTSVNAVFGSSMEVGVRVEAEDLVTGEIRHTTSAYFVMVGLDEHTGRPTHVPKLELDMPEAERRHQEAAERRSRRKRFR